MLSIYPIVEGHGDVAAVPVLLRRFAHEIFEISAFQVLTPYRLHKDRMNIENHLERVVTLARLKLNQCEGARAILILRDADDDCPGIDAPALLARAERIASPVPVCVVFAKAEYESWFLAAVHSLRGRRDIVDYADAPPDPEAIRGAKEHLRQQRMVPGATYSPTVDQPALTAKFDFEEARKSCPSFDKLWRDLERLFRQEA